jgi:D-hexose-6-phosphate mutarotase
MAETKMTTQTNVVTPARVTFLDGQNDLSMLEVNTRWSNAEIYAHGAQVTQFRLKNEPPLLFMSQFSRFSDGQPIRGGIPVIFPWFGLREGLGQHGFARVKDWDLKEIIPGADGSVSLRFRLPDCPEAATLPAFTADYIVAVGERLSCKLVVTNDSRDDPFTFENCLHTYFEVSDVTAIRIEGLKGVHYVDTVANFTQIQESGEAFRIGAEVDRIYMNTQHAVEIIDQRFGRKIRIEKEGSLSTVVWNPWIAKAQQMQDFGNEEYQRMVCVESGNVANNKITLAPGETSTLGICVSSETIS